MSDIEREAHVDAPNPLGIAGIEFVEYTTPRPQAFGTLLEQLGFKPVARHRSREVALYRQGRMNVVINAHGLPPGTGETPQIAALALRVRDAGAAHRRVIDLGAWPVPANPLPMELHIPGVHGVGSSRIFFVDRFEDFSIYDVDFVPLSASATVQRDVPATAALHWFGIVQYVGPDRAADWCAFYESLFGFTSLPADERFGILPAGTILRSPCGTFWLQLIEPGADEDGSAGAEHWQRLAFGAPDVPATVRAWRERGIEFIEAGALKPGTRGALTKPLLGGAMFELVHHDAQKA